MDDIRIYLDYFPRFLRQAVNAIFFLLNVKCLIVAEEIHPSWGELVLKKQSKYTPVHC